MVEPTRVRRALDRLQLFVFVVNVMVVFGIIAYAIALLFHESRWGGVVALWIMLTLWSIMRD